MLKSNTLGVDIVIQKQILKLDNEAESLEVLSESLSVVESSQSVLISERKFSDRL